MARWGGRIEAVKNFADRRVGPGLRLPDRGDRPRRRLRITRVDREDRPYRAVEPDPELPLGPARRPAAGHARLELARPAPVGLPGLRHGWRLPEALPAADAVPRPAALRRGGGEPARRRHRALQRPEPATRGLPEGLPNAEIFIDERFFAGGATTHRAYGRDELGLLGRQIPRLGAAPTGRLRRSAATACCCSTWSTGSRSSGRSGARSSTTPATSGRTGGTWTWGRSRRGSGWACATSRRSARCASTSGWKLDRDLGDLTRKGEEENWGFSLTFGNPF